MLVYIYACIHTTSVECPFGKIERGLSCTPCSNASSFAQGPQHQRSQNQWPASRCRGDLADSVSYFLYPKSMKWAWKKSQYSSSAFHSCLMSLRGPRPGSNKNCPRADRLQQGVRNPEICGSMFFVNLEVDKRLLQEHCSLPKPSCQLHTKLSPIFTLRSGKHGAFPRFSQKKGHSKHHASFSERARPISAFVGSHI